METNEQNTNAPKKDRISYILWILYIAFLVLSVVIIGKIIWLQKAFHVDSDLEYLFTPSSTRTIIEPQRGMILDQNGKILAMSTPMYQIYMDCSILKSEYSQMGEDGQKKENIWLGKAKELSDSLYSFYGDKSAQEYYKLITDSRNNRRRHVKIGYQIDHGALQRVKAFPLFKEGANRGGIIIEKFDTRQYPYGSLARRVIGYVKDNSKSNGNNKIGLEGKFDSQLHGIEGVETLRTTEKRRHIRNFDSLYTKAEDGHNLHTTLNINIQDIADRALRRQIQDDPEIEGACMIVMEVKTGAIRAMVNLNRDTTSGRVNETYNWAIGRAGEPGSVFKSITLTTLLEDKRVNSVEEKLPILRGRFRNYPYDDHLASFGYTHGTDSITVREALQISSNQAFCYLAVTNYEKSPQDFIDKIYMYKLGEAWDFDLTGLKTPTLMDPKSPTWSSTDLGVTAYGYGITETPLHILTFYNAIANKGKMMKPYLVENIEFNGKIVEQRGPSILNASICSKATADTLTRALRAVVTDGTGKTQLGKAKIPVAGKTGTSRVVLDPSIALPHDPYHDKWGRKQNQGTFVGFFPDDNPQYSIIAVVYSTVSSASFYGGTKPAAAVCETVNGMYGLEDIWGLDLTATAPMPAMGGMEDKITTSEVGTKTAQVPDVSGMGLKDAIYTIEKSGFKCSYSGVGHVTRQSPSAGANLTKGGTITITLK